jgi:hypothetical protein
VQLGREVAELWVGKDLQSRIIMHGTSVNALCCTLNFPALNQQCSSPRATGRVATPDQGIDVPL